MTMSYRAFWEERIERYKQELREAEAMLRVSERMDARQAAAE